jgi:hypothetical protein
MNIAFHPEQMGARSPATPVHLSFFLLASLSIPPSLRPSHMSKSILVRALAPSNTCHMRWSVLVRRAPDPQLAEVVPSPAFDPAAGHDRARVGISRGDGDGGDV